MPVRSGLAELRGAVDERPLVATDRLSLAAMGIAALATREVRLTIGSAVGGGEQLFAAWRFWPRRPYIAGGVSAPAPWGGVWNVLAYSGRQAFTSDVPTADRTGARLGTADWFTARLRWNVARGQPTGGTVGEPEARWAGGFGLPHQVIGSKPGRREHMVRRCWFFDGGDVFPSAIVS